MSGAADIDAKKAKFSLDAPTLLGTKIDALVLDTVAYYKIAGPLAAMMGGGASADKFTKVDVPASSGKPVTDTAELDKQIDEFKAALDKLPTPPTKGPDEKCGDQDCYRVTLKLTQADLKTLDPTSTTEGDFSLDLWTRKNDRFPAKLSWPSRRPGRDHRHDVRVQVRRRGLRGRPGRRPARSVTRAQRRSGPGPAAAVPGPLHGCRVAPSRRPRAGCRPTMER